VDVIDLKPLSNQEKNDKSILGLIIFIDLPFCNLICYFRDSTARISEHPDEAENEIEEIEEGGEDFGPIEPESFTSIAATTTTTTTTTTAPTTTTTTTTAAPTTKPGLKNLNKGLFTNYVT
jgi:hypothetical protein